LSIYEIRELASRTDRTGCGDGLQNTRTALQARFAELSAKLDLAIASREQIIEPDLFILSGRFLNISAQLTHLFNCLRHRLIHVVGVSRIFDVHVFHREINAPILNYPERRSTCAPYRQRHIPSCTLHYSFPVAAPSLDFWRIIQHCVAWPWQHG
jgi:hypothetical protein